MVGHLLLNFSPQSLPLHCCYTAYSVLFVCQHGFQVWCFFHLIPTCWFFLTGPHKLLILHPYPVFFLHVLFQHISSEMSLSLSTQPSAEQPFFLTGSSRSSRGPSFHPPATFPSILTLPSPLPTSPKPSRNTMVTKSSATSAKSKAHFHSYIA